MGAVQKKEDEDVKPVSIVDLKRGDLLNLSVLESAFETRDTEIMSHKLTHTADGTTHEFKLQNTPSSLASA